MRSISAALSDTVGAATGGRPRCGAALASIVGVGVLLGSGSAIAQNIELQLLYDSRYNQIGTAAPTTPFTNIAQAFFTANGADVAYIDLTDAFGDLYSPDDPDATAFFSFFLSQQNTRATLLSEVPAGDYSFYWENSDGDPFSATLVQPLASGLWPSQVPAFTPGTIPVLQNMNAANAVNVSVNQFVPSPQSNQNLGGFFINEWVSGDYGAVAHAQLALGSGAVATTRTIPANTLQPGRRYWITWLFAQSVNSPGYQGPGTAVSQFRSSTRYAFETAAAPTCPADFNHDGTANSGDFFDFLQVFFVSAPAADVNHDGTVNSQDFFDFLGVFFAGC